MNTSYSRIFKILSRLFGTKFFSLILIGTIATSCNEASVVGLDVQPQEDLLNLGWVDTTTITCKTVKEDSLNTGILHDTALLGKYMDPIFGSLFASLATQLHLPSINPDFGKNPVCDSVIFKLVYSPNYYGKRGRVSQNVNVYQLNENLTGTSYYSNNSVGYSSVDLANNYSFTPKPNDSVLIDGRKVKPLLRIPLQASFGQSILNKKGLSELSSVAAFQEFTKGFYITTENTVLAPGSGDGNIVGFNTADAFTTITLYYHYTIETISLPHVDSTTGYKSYDLNLANANRYSKFNHDFTSGSSYFQQQLNGTSLIDTTVFIQGAAGTKVKVEFPFLKNINDLGKVAINKAELVVKIDTDPLYQLDTFSAASKLTLFGINENGTIFELPDAFEAHEGISGAYTTAKEYHFNVERYIQMVLNGTLTNSGLYLIVHAGSLNASRIAIGGGQNLGPQKMKLNLTFTKLH